MNTIECEVRAFIDEARYRELIEYFKREEEYLGRDEQVTYYFSGPHDLRIQKNSSGAKIWMKKGALHDDHREEIELKLAGDDFETAERLFLAMGHTVEIKWFRTRHDFKWGDVSVAIDDTRGYGRIIELEKLCGENEKEATVAVLKARMAELGVPLTPKEDFAKAYAEYKEHWRERTGEQVPHIA
jgi:predicted adenylyl cyclase CyaB